MKPKLRKRRKKPTLAHLSSRLSRTEITNFKVIIYLSSFLMPLLLLLNFLDF